MNVSETYCLYSLKQQKVTNEQQYKFELIEKIFKKIY